MKSTASLNATSAVTPSKAARGKTGWTYPWGNDWEQNEKRCNSSGKADGWEFTAPVDSGVQSLQFTIFAECVKSITVTAPSGAQAEGTRLSSGRIVVLDAPEHGEWRVKLAGTGYFTAVAQAKGGVVFPPLRLERPKPGLEQSLGAYLAGPVETAEFRIVARNGATLQVIPMTQIGDTEFRGVFTPPAEPFHIAVEGKDNQGLAFRRVHAPLLDAKQ